MSESGIATASHLLGGQSALARILKCTPQCVQRWVAQGWAAAKRCKEIEAAVGGRVTRAQLNPQIYGDGAFA